MLLMGVLASDSKGALDFTYSNSGYTFEGDPEGDWQLTLLTS